MISICNVEECNENVKTIFQEEFPGSMKNLDSQPDFGGRSDRKHQ